MNANSGQQAEQRALEHLQQRGLRLLARNWRCQRGELDLVMLDGDTVVFIEVRYRKHAAWGGASESIDVHKRHRLILAAQYFLLQEPRWSDHPCRFDVLTFGPPNQEPSQPNWIPNAFEA